VLICYSNLNVKLGGAYCGMSDALDGASHHALEDIAVMRSLPNMVVLCPSDERSTRAMTRWACDYNGPVYLRLSREVYPDIYDSDIVVEPGKGRVVLEGSDCTVFACGIMVGKAVEAAGKLLTEGISVQVVDIMSIKPLDTALIEDCIRKTGAVVSAEEHSVIGGLGSAVAEAMAKLDVSAPMEFVGTNDTFTESGNYNLLLKKYGIDADGVIRGIRKVLGRKKG
jgi:transketolase